MIERAEIGHQSDIEVNHSGRRCRNKGCNNKLTKYNQQDECFSCIKSRDKDSAGFEQTHKIIESKKADKLENDKGFNWDQPNDPRID